MKTGKLISDVDRILGKQSASETPMTPKEKRVLESYLRSSADGAGNTPLSREVFLRVRNIRAALGLRLPSELQDKQSLYLTLSELQDKQSVYLTANGMTGLEGVVYVSTNAPDEPRVFIETKPSLENPTGFRIDINKSNVDELELYPAPKRPENWVSPSLKKALKQFTPGTVVTYEFWEGSGRVKRLVGTVLTLDWTDPLSTGPETEPRYFDFSTTSSLSTLQNFRVNPTHAKTV